ncbi:MAG TPA: D-aminoacyl-tRNA deacylase [Bacteroidia bacterium]|nr:D-aminoacyl-tRNA deacylase [Bacteroidia bacterium]
MRVVIQRVTEASVAIDGKMHSSIGIGLLILLGISLTDSEREVLKVVSKIPKLRIFNDSAGLMNVSAADAGADYLVVSQFTLFADTKKGNRPSYIQSARPEQAIPLYHTFLQMLEKECGKEVASGVFGADMNVSLVNDGPVTIIIDTNDWERSGEA